MKDDPQWDLGERMPWRNAHHPERLQAKGASSQRGPSGGGLGPEGQAGSLKGVQGEDLLTAAQLGLLEAAQGLGV